MISDEQLSRLEGKCPFDNPPKEEHTCPYEVMDGDKDFKCVCCEECERICIKETW